MPVEILPPADADEYVDGGAAGGDIVVEMPETEDAPEFVENAERCFAIADSFRKLGSGEILLDLSLAAEATAYINLAFARLLDGRELGEYRSNFLRWCEEYETAWRRENKTSELALIVDLMKRAMFE